ncbi:hypothetical protein ACFSMX_02495 [Flectobacillus roseus]
MRGRWYYFQKSGNMRL